MKKKENRGKQPAATKRAGTPKAGRKPIERMPIYLFGTPVLQVGVYPGNRKKTRSIGLMTEAQFRQLLEDSAKKSGGGGKKSPSEPETAQPPTVPADKPSMKVVITVGKSITGYDLTPDQVADYETLCRELDQNHGIFIRRIVPWRLVSEFAHDKVFFLTPNAEDAMTPQAYVALHDALYNESLAAIGLFVSGNGVEPVAVVACEGGLVMWQLPQAGQSNNIGEAIPANWNAPEVSAKARGEMKRLIKAHTFATLGNGARMDPRNELLEKIADAAFVEGERPVRGSTPAAASLEELLAAIK